MSEKQLFDLTFFYFFLVLTFTELNNTIIEYCFKEQCGRRFTASMYNTIEQLNKILTSLRLTPFN